jgi:uncharacterized membrane protein
MKGNNLRDYTGNFLFALNVFILFLVVFENELIVPLWLQPFGRMHPLILHFPIVLLLLSMVMEFFRFKTAYYTQEFYQSFTSNLLLIGIISSGITVIMGLFLSQEEGYANSVLAWHKWAGISVFFIASIIYTCRNFSWYKAPVAKAGAIITTLCLIFAGHFGAALTHGDNYIWQPVLALSHPVVPVEEAVLFDHVIKPVFEKKCVGCHNPDKLKGKLILTDSAFILKGGKTGELFVAGKPDSSLLLQRIGLPIEDKKHMPPSGKTQITSDELDLLYLWIKSGAKFNQKVTALPAGDSLRLLATAFLKPDETAGEVFDFAAADEQIVQKLNTNYRVVSPLAQESPALTVNIYNKDAYTSQTLDQLKDVKLQIVSLELSKMPVKNEDMKYIARFENLRRLNLNFSGITGKGLEALTPLKHLNSLSLSGTKVNYPDLQQYLPLFKSLSTVAVWDTELSTSEIQQLQAANKHIEFLAGFKDDGSHPIKLNTPRIKNKSVVFGESLALQLYHPVKDVEIRFTTDGSEPDSITSSLFKGETTLEESTVIKARAYKAGWLSSDVASLNVYRSGHKPDSVILLSRLNRVHPANGAQTFFDHQLGTFNANSPAWANNWAGFINNDMELLLEFKTPRMISSVALNTLIETETFIFPPAALEIWGGASEDNLQLIARMKPGLPQDYSKPFIKLIDCNFKAQNISYLKIIAKPVMKLPAWHKRKEKPALLLVDEILIN